jgi:murein DD-endopeptidase MepM/ murein hydrolase activator NlpD
LQQTPSGLDRILDRLAPLTPSPDGRPTSPNQVDPFTRLCEAGARVARRNGVDRLVPVAICGLLVVAALFSASPQGAHASANTAATAAPQTSVVAPVALFGQGDGPAAQDFSDLYLGDGSIPNTLQNPGVGTDAKALMKTYTVRGGDTLAAIARRYQLATSTVYWANKGQLASPASIRVGQKLLIPPMDGLLVTVGAKTTLAALAKKYYITPQDIIDANNLPDTTLTLGSTLIIPGATGGNMPAPPKTKAQLAYRSPGGWFWPVGGKNYISQYFWSGHRAIDIAAKKGTPVYAAISGTVIFVGNRGFNGGGNVIWVEEGPRLYTTYNHLSGWLVHVGQVIYTGQHIGSVGMTGDATGPHLHFEVWLGRPWANNVATTAVNPCIYLAGC